MHEFFADQAPRAVIVCDRRPSLGIYGCPAAVARQDRGGDRGDRRARESERASARGVTSDAGLRQTPSARSVCRPAAAPSDAWLGERAAGPAEAPPDALARSLDLLVRRRAALPVGTFVFVVSDFLEPVPSRRWTRLRGLGWDVTPVLVQDPVWEQSFPRIGGVTVSFVEPGSARPTRRLARSAPGRGPCGGERAPARADDRAVQAARLRPGRRGHQRPGRDHPAPPRLGRTAPVAQASRGMKLVAAVAHERLACRGHRARRPATHPCGGRTCDGRRRRHVHATWSRPGSTRKGSTPRACVSSPIPGPSRRSGRREPGTAPWARPSSSGSSSGSAASILPVPRSKVSAESACPGRA